MAAVHLQALAGFVRTVGHYPDESDIQVDVFSEPHVMRRCVAAEHYRCLVCGAIVDDIEIAAHNARVAAEPIRPLMWSDFEPVMNELAELQATLPMSLFRTDPRVIAFARGATDYDHSDPLTRDDRMKKCLLRMALRDECGWWTESQARAEAICKLEPWPDVRTVDTQVFYK